MRSANHCPFGWAHLSDTGACALLRRYRQIASARDAAKGAANAEPGEAGARSASVLAFAVLLRLVEYAGWDSMARILRALPDRNEDFTFH